MDPQHHQTSSRSQMSSTPLDPEVEEPTPETIAPGSAANMQNPGQETPHLVGPGFDSSSPSSAPPGKSNRDSSRPMRKLFSS